VDRKGKAVAARKGKGSLEARGLMRALIDPSNGKIVTLAKAEPDVLYRVIELAEPTPETIYLLSIED